MLRVGYTPNYPSMPAVKREMTRFAAQQPEEGNRHPLFNRRGLLATLAWAAVGGLAVFMQNWMREDTLTLKLREAQHAATQVAPMESKSIPISYPQNTVVYGGSLQDAPTYTGMINGDFTQKLFLPFNRKDAKVRSMADAFNRQEVSGGWIRRERGTVQMPVKSPRVPKGWRLEDNELVKQGKLKRYAILIAGEGFTRLGDSTRKAMEQHHFDQDVALARKTLVENFGVPDSEDSILVLNAPSAEQLQEKLRTWLAPKQAANSEVMFYYSGHGASFLRRPSDAQLQGSAVGTMFIREKDTVLEDELKVWLHQSAEKFSEVLCIFDACGSGAFIVEPNLSVTKEIIPAVKPQMG
jgi:hypothetical protein